ncbi:MAG: hypothetical protein U5L45_03610 [Saprospiraceae bacterium]|nr:hypothetical protein [Saprospiraceae bacterium]
MVYFSGFVRKMNHIPLSARAKRANHLESSKDTTYFTINLYIISATN